MVGAAVAAAATFLVLVLIPRLPIPDPTGWLATGMKAVFVLSSVWATLGLLGQFFERISWGKSHSQAHARGIWKFTSYAVWGIVLVILVFGQFGNVATTALGIGLIGAALAFAMQKPLLNLAAWTVITSRGLFRIGDRVEIGGVKGFVTDIGLMSSQLQEFGEWMHADTYTGRIVEVPNALVFDTSVRNYTKDFPIVWDSVETLVTYTSDIDAAKELAFTAAVEVVGGIMFDNYEKYRHSLALGDIAQDLIRTPEIRMEFAQEGVRIIVIYFCPADERSYLRSQIVEKIWRRFVSDSRVGIAYPHVTVAKTHYEAPKGPEWVPPSPHERSRAPSPLRQGIVTEELAEK